jgi:hypothetical protein
MRSWPFRLALVAVCTIAIPAASEHEASAYAISSAITTGCHERITQQALRTIRSQLQTAPAVTPDSNDLALVDDLPFDLDDDMHDLAAATFLVGVRDNDLKGKGASDVDALATIHGNPENQREHCLRAIDDDEPDGSTRALEACKAFIRERIADALQGLDANGVPDPNSRADIDVTLGLRGRVTASLPRYWVSMGQAIHTIEDSFAHTFRTDDRMRVRTVLNWIEYVDNDEVESRDGPVHRSGLDQCDNLDDLRSRNYGVATQAAIDLMHATLDPTLSHDAKLAAVDAVLVKYLSYEPGCTDANSWCNAPEQQYAIAPSCGCSVVGLRRNGALAGVLCMLSLAFLIARRRRRTRHAALPLIIACLTFPSLAHAQPDDAPAPAPAPDPAPAPAPAPAPDPADGTKPPPGVPTTTEVKAEQKETAHQSLFGLYAAGSGSITDPGVSGQLGVRLRLSDRWTVGLDGELNGWFGVQTKTLRTGAFNAYATGIFRYPLRFEQVNLRTTANLGTSTMLIDLYGAPKGTTGLFLGFTPIGLEWKAASKLYVIWDALGVALPIPQLKGAPFAYPQYRTALGVELAF